MSDALDATLQALQQHSSAIDRELLRLAEKVGGADDGRAAAAMSAVERCIQRVAEAARAMRAACPVCKKAQAAIQFEAVNKFSGVWSLPDCAACRGLARLIGAVEKAARDNTAAQNT